MKHGKRKSGGDFFHQKVHFRDLPFKTKYYDVAVSPFRLKMKEVFLRVFQQTQFESIEKACFRPSLRGV
ncbi:MAG TPA: hypothetical protein DEE98_08510 [Elusimicrobia bacterium]|nr:MAG: hypothetical protein A2278_05100 [Elusimicrobia bacterium RIFOXYA12_FULL_49_49]OGS09269.1 MAG: hypothetical protein A2386_02445 [Elusimicrobia bacterium RIFOXYB1_FULL_48_9]OGS09290.1 MAG: hypothetical protein A2204_05220 [Elusimicrobia bacterium RIFOXYA1_FULL_47_7]OGS15208.1 MAG: hypothetical protein A2251_06830 [Elusimicrobia bacterium RIFOXYA2_FULL_47_53]OGS25937.1 MAG: hypothetical protein A2339_00975 [Elusimicrobia bacterium RIFOXYB12_FULL_50_12]OGS30259.1 MAG: hypothetical protein